MTKTHAAWIGFATGIMTAFIWGSWPVVTRLGVSGNESGAAFLPQDIVAVRFLFAGVLLLPYYIRNQVYRKISPLRSLALSCSAGGLYAFLASSSLQYIPAAQLSVSIMTTMITFSAIGGYFLLGERKSPPQIAGYAIVMLGCIALNWSQLSGLHNINPLGYLLALLGGLCWASFTVSSRYWKLDPWDAVSATSLYSLLIWVPLLYIMLPQGRDTSHSLSAWAFQGVSQGIITAICGLWLYAFTVQKLGASRGALFTALVPIIALTLGALILDEQPQTLDIIGVIAAALGMSLAIKQPRLMA